MMSKFRERMLLISLTTLPMLVPLSASAQPTQNEASSDDATPQAAVGEILVTARKRQESVLDVPVAITALSGAALQALNVKTIEQVVAVTPGLVLNNATTGAARSDRSKTALIIRGMAPSIGNQTTSVFVNGVPISDGIVTSIFDFERVEVLKGPQSAYFGRQTFAGAINLITREPTNEWTGDFSALSATGNYFDVNGAVGGPLIKDILSFRASGRYFDRDGSWKNQAEPGHTLGDQSTKSGTLSLKFTPSADLTIKLFGAIAQDKDGAGATGVIVPGQSNCELKPGTHYFCGKLPRLVAGQPSARTEITPGVAALLGQEYSPLMSDDENIDGFGLKRDTSQLSASIEYDLGGVKLNSLTGYNRDNWTVLYPLNGRASPYDAPITGFPFLDHTDWPLGIQHKQRDFSQEFRVTSSQDQSFRWLVGGSYLWQRGREGFNQLYYFSGLTSNFSPTTEAKTYAGFFGLAYDISSQLTIDFDGRYQSDKLISRNGETNAIGYQKTYKNFTPRVSVEFKPNPGTLIYATYSKGVNPGLGSDPLLAGGVEAYVDQLIAAGVTHGVKPEKLDNYELGFKGRALDGRLTFAADVYYDIWTDKITEQTILIPRPGLTPVFVSVFTNLGKVNLKGIEAEMTAEPVDGLILNLSGAINDSKIKKGTCSFCLTQSGDSSAIGNQLPFTSKYSAQGSLEYSGSLSALDTIRLYGRSEFTFKTGMYESEGNYAKSQNATSVNFRLGARSESFSIEGFVTNAFNNKAYTSVLPDFELDRPTQTFATYDTVYVGLPYLRTWGMRVGYHF